LKVNTVYFQHILLHVGSIRSVKDGAGCTAVNPVAPATTFRPYLFLAQRLEK